MANLAKNLSNVVAWARIIECLLDGVHTVKELHDESGLGLNTIRKLMTVMKRRDRIFIAAWERDSSPAGRYTIPAYALGSGPDVLRPLSKTATERSRRRRLVANPFPTTATESTFMKLYKTIAGSSSDDSLNFSEFASSASEASKARTRLKKEGLVEVKTEEVDINTDRQSLIRFLNSLTAHESCTLAAVTEKLEP